MIYDATIPEERGEIAMIKVGHICVNSNDIELITPLEISPFAGELLLSARDHSMRIVDRQAAESLIRGLQKAIELEWI